MKKYLSICLLFLAFAACKKSDEYSKPGVSLPAVNNLSLQKTQAQKITLGWTVPNAIPAEIEQPLSINIQVTEVISPTRTIVINEFTVPASPASFVYDIPNATKTYRFIVKLFGRTRNKDVNYASSIYSLGQTVQYNP
ncbi:DUF4945 domain-containing protein [Pedobacter sp. SYP-B3415]|uniref:DUF4945 domain-containing protein n=1 Tax=Pedobacter sp. SYP-B3415 TaxID=2496641 RepID=UPI00101BD423|nr:DUF4945 domain-containing protein [Pedobacter sp. SYP-B3415]